MISLNPTHSIHHPKPDRTSANTADTPDAQREIHELAARDRQVRTHERAHVAAAGGLAHGGVRFEYTRGPDGRQYATGGEVSIDVSPVAGDPEATIDKAQKIRRAALAPAEPSQQDRAVAAKASAMANEARIELQREARTEDAGEEGGICKQCGVRHAAGDEEKPTSRIADAYTDYPDSVASGIDATA